MTNKHPSEIPDDDDSGGASGDVDGPRLNAQGYIVSLRDTYAQILCQYQDDIRLKKPKARTFDVEYTADERKEYGYDVKLDNEEDQGYKGPGR